MTNLKPHSYATFDIIRSEQLKTSTFLVILKHKDGTFSTGILIDSPSGKEHGWYLFDEQKFDTEVKAIRKFYRLCESSPVTVHG